MTIYLIYLNISFIFYVQRCLAHLVRKAIGITESVNARTTRIGTLILDNLRDFIHAIKSGTNKTELDQIISSLQGICHVGKRVVRHEKLKALAQERNLALVN